MDIILLSNAAIAIISKLIVKRGVDLTEQAGKAALDVAKQIYNVIKQEFQQNDKMADQTLDSFERDPETFESRLQKILQQQLEQSQTFAQRLQELVEEFEKNAEPEVVEQIIAKGGGAVATRGGVAAGKGGYAAGGNMYIGTAPDEDDQ